MLTWLMLILICPWIDNISALARTVKNATVENIKVTGSILGRDGIAGIINKGDTGAQLTNVAFIGNLTGVGNRGWGFRWNCRRTLER